MLTYVLPSIIKSQTCFDEIQVLKFVDCVKLSIEIINNNSYDHLCNVLNPSIRVGKSSEVRYLKSRNCTDINDLLELIIRELTDAKYSILCSRNCHSLFITLTIVKFIINTDNLLEDSLKDCKLSDDILQSKEYKLLNLMWTGSKYTDNRRSIELLIKRGNIRSDSKLRKFIKSICSGGIGESSILMAGSTAAAIA